MNFVKYDWAFDAVKKEVGAASRLHDVLNRIKCDNSHVWKGMAKKRCLSYLTSTHKENCLGKTKTIFDFLLYMTIMILKTAVEGARGFYISRRGAEVYGGYKTIECVNAFHPQGEDLQSRLV